MSKEGMCYKRQPKHSDMMLRHGLMVGERLMVQRVLHMCDCDREARMPAERQGSRRGGALPRLLIWNQLFRLYIVPDFYIIHLIGMP